MPVDTHAHFDMVLEDGETDEAGLFSSMRECGINRSVQISTEPNAFRWSRDFAVKHREEGVLYSIGIHPSTKADSGDLRGLSDFVGEAVKSDDKELLFGIGECGLDFYRMRQAREMQMESFAYQLGEAKKRGLPVIVHSRDAMEEVIKIIRESSHGKGVMHCFPGDSGMAKKVLDLGFHISFAGNVTYNKAHELHDSARYVPLDRLLVETDAPFLTPVPLRGKRNRPEYLLHTLKFIAVLRKMQYGKLADSVDENFTALAKCREMPL